MRLNFFLSACTLVGKKGSIVKLHASFHVSIPSYIPKQCRTQPRGPPIPGNFEPPTSIQTALVLLYTDRTAWGSTGPDYLHTVILETECPDLSFTYTLVLLCSQFVPNCWGVGTWNYDKACTRAYLDCLCRLK